MQNLIDINSNIKESGATVILATGDGRKAAAMYANLESDKA
jgi:hypothetical protein